MNKKKNSIILIFLFVLFLINCCSNQPETLISIFRNKNISVSQIKKHLMQSDQTVTRIPSNIENFPGEWISEALVSTAGKIRIRIDSPEFSNGMFVNGKLSFYFAEDVTPIDDYEKLLKLMDIRENLIQNLISAGFQYAGSDPPLQFSDEIDRTELYVNSFWRFHISLYNDSVEVIVGPHREPSDFMWAIMG